VPTNPEEGALRRGDALLLYTDGLVEVPGRDIDEGIDKLLGEAQRLVPTRFRSGAADLVTALQGDVARSDDCALVLVWRS
jgi:serine phosphatase RsbU (regulator of sigma subunit)